MICQIEDPVPPPYPGDKEGYRLIQFKAMSPDLEEMGFIKVSYIPLTLWKRLYPDPLHFLAAFRGWHLPLGENDIYALATAVALYWRHKVNVTFDSVEECEAFLDACRASKREEIQDFRKAVVDNPYVDYIKVHEKWRRQGIATFLYSEAAKYMASHYGLTLKGVGLQQPAATAVWEKMAASPEYPTHAYVRPDGKIRYYLDYR